MAEVRVPTTGNAGEPAVVSVWNVTLGDAVSAGETLLSLETAKATVDVVAPVGGTITEIYYPEGAEAPEFAVLALIDTPHEHSPAETAPQKPRETKLLPNSATLITESSNLGRRNISPRARKLAEAQNIATNTLTGNGPNGRIIAADVPVSPAVLSEVKPKNQTITLSDKDETAEDYQVIPVRGARKITAKRMHASLNEAAQVTLTRYASADTLQSYAKRLAARPAHQENSKIGITELVLFTVSRVLINHPEANSWFLGEEIRCFRDVHLGLAVDTDNALVVPVIPHANTLTLAQLAKNTRAAITRAREGKATHEEMTGSTFTVSNLGSLGIHWFTPVLNPPESCILGIGAIHKLHPDSPSQLPLSLTFDHRALDGAAAARLLADIAKNLEHIDTLSAH